MSPVTIPASVVRVVVVVVLCASVGCGGPKGEPAPKPVVSSAPTPSPESPGAEAAASETPEGPGDAPKPPPYTPFGLPECDTFLTRYLSCVEGRVPADQRGKFEEELRENRTRWWKLAEMQQGTVAVGLACRIFAESKKTDLAVDYGCEF
jgi:hypothetical protein